RTLRRPLRAILLQHLLRLLQQLRRLLGLRAGVLRAVRRRLPHGIRGVLQIALRVGEILALLALPFGLSPELLELPGHLLDFVGHGALARSGAGLLLSGAALLFSLLELPTCELLQLVGEIVDLLRLTLLAGALLLFVL